MEATHASYLKSVVKFGHMWSEAINYRSARLIAVLEAFLLNFHDHEREEQWHSTC